MRGRITTLLEMLLGLLVIGQAPSSYGAPSSPTSQIGCVPRQDGHDHDSIATVDPWKLASVAAVGTTGFVVGHAVLQELWWKGEPRDFHINFAQDWTYALGADKVGHAYFTSMATSVLARSFRWTGMDSATAIWSGAAVALLYQTYNEVRDGYSVRYGFSPGDMAANIIGASLPIAQHYYPWLRNFTVQISFYPSDAFRRGMYGAIIDDYESTTHWLSVDVHGILPTSAKAWYPPWLNLAVGHSVRGILGETSPQHVFIVSLDWNLQRIDGLPEWLRNVMSALHMYHLPAPALEIHPNRTWFGLRF